MPEQTPAGALPVTSAPFEAPFETLGVRYGVGGLNLKASRDALEPHQLTRLTNLTHDGSRSLAPRPGQTSLATAGTTHHSIGRLNNPVTAAFTRIWGVDAALYRGMSGALTLVEAGFSGSPLSLVPYRPTLSGETWMFVGDTAKMRKVRSDGLSLPIGLPAPATPVTSAIAAIYSTRIAGMDAGTDGSDAANWTGTAGEDRSDPPVASGVPTATDIVGLSGNAVEFVTVPGSAVEGYYSLWGHALSAAPIDLTTLQGGAVEASDQDFMHFYFRIDHPEWVEEVRVYLVVSSDFDATVLPGRSDSANTIAYVKAFRQADLTPFVQDLATALDTGVATRDQTLVDEFLRDKAIPDDRGSWESTRAEIDPARAAPETLGTGQGQWTAFGEIGVPLRRLDFQKIGHADATQLPDWSTVQGLIVYVRTTTNEVVKVAIDDVYLTGGAGPDTAEPGAQKLDYRITHYDPRTGAEGNPSPVQADALHLDSLRRPITLTPFAPYGDAAVRQRFYRRGGSLIDDWYFLGTNSSDGGAFLDELDDSEIRAAGTLELDHDQPVTTVAADGSAVLNQPVPALFGPVDDLLFACGDPYRPGDLYWSKPGEPDHWPPQNHVEVCSPSEQLVQGGVYGGQAFVFSRERLYFVLPNLTGQGGVSVQPTACRRGLLTRQSFTIGPGGIYFVDKDGVWVTAGGPPELIDDDIRPLFRGQTVNGYRPITTTTADPLRLAVFGHDLYLLYQDDLGARQVLVYSLLYRFWRHYLFARSPACLIAEDTATSLLLLIGGFQTGASYTHSGENDDGVTIAWQARTGALDAGRPREDKLLGDVALDIDAVGTTATLAIFLNDETVQNTSQVLELSTGRQRYIFDPFGTVPQQARTVSLDLTGIADTGIRPTLYQIGVSITPQPDATMKRVTNWDNMGQGAESYLTGVTIEANTYGEAVPLLVEYDLDGSTQTAATFSITCDGRHLRQFSWPAVKANLVRIRPSEDCAPWILYRLSWLTQAEPPRIARWDINHENAWDQYYTGLDLEVDTLGITKVVEVYADGLLVATENVTTSGRRVHHITLPPGRAHLFRFVAIDDNPGLLYAHRWHLEAEPSEQANWNQNFTIGGTHTDKWVKGITFEVDTFGVAKVAVVEVDGVVIATLPINTTGRTVLHRAFPQSRGRVLRFISHDTVPSRLYGAAPIFDEEPLGLTRWETQETDHGLPAWHLPIFAHLTLRAEADVTLTLTAYDQIGTPLVKSYLVPATGTTKVKRFVPFEAVKGVLFKYLLTSSTAFWLYREESAVVVQPWGGQSLLTRHIFGNEDLTVPTRSMISAVGAAGRSGGGSS